MSPRTEVSTAKVSDPPNKRLISGTGWMAGIGHDKTHHASEPTSALGHLRPDDGPRLNAKKSAMPARYSHRFPRDLDFAMRVFQVDSSWYENYWLKGRKPRPAGMVARNLPTVVSCLRLACDRVASVRRAVLAIVLRPKTHPEI